MTSVRNLGRAFLQDFFCVILAGLSTYYLSAFIGSFYCNAIGNCSAGVASVDFTVVMGLLLGYLLFVPLFLRLFGSTSKNWWIAVLTLPIFVFLIYTEIRLTQLGPLVLSGAVGFLVGTLGKKAFWKLVPGVMARIS